MNYRDWPNSVLEEEGRLKPVLADAMRTIVDLRDEVATVALPCRELCARWPKCLCIEVAPVGWRNPWWNTPGKPQRWHYYHNGVSLCEKWNADESDHRPWPTLPKGARGCAACRKAKGEP